MTEERLILEGPILRAEQEYAVHHGDCITHMAEMPAASVDFAVFSPPFPSLFAYTSKPEDIGNSDDLRGESRIHLSFFYRQLARVLKPGRVAMVHVMQIPKLVRTGEERGTHDFRGLNIRLGVRAGLEFHYDWLIRKNPQAQAIRTRSRELQFAGLESDRAKCRGAHGDYLIKFMAKGENAVKVDSVGDVTRNEWIDWAEDAWWQGIKETDTLNTREAKSESDTKHICPLQLGVIDRLVRLYTNPGEIVFSPFAGIGSEGYVSLKLGRRFYGCEIKDEYHAAALRNLNKAIEERKESQMTLFDKPEPVAAASLESWD
jgi:DNA modification methylase